MVLKFKTKMLIYRVSLKSTPFDFDEPRERNDKISGLFKLIGIFDDLQRKCIYFAF